MTIELVALTIGTCASLLWLGLMGRKLEGRVNTLEDRIDSATFVPPCAHQWRVIATTVVPSIQSNGFSARGLSEWELRRMIKEEREAAQGSTVLVLVCDKCGERVTQTVKGAPNA